MQTRLKKYTARQGLAWQALFATCLALLLFALASPAHSSTPDPLGLYPTVWGKVGIEHDVDPYLLYALALRESRRKSEDGLVRPHPYAIRTNGSNPEVHYPSSRVEAEKILKRLLARTDNVDVGILQVNVKYHGSKVTSPADLLDYRTNIRVAARILVEAMGSTTDPIIGVGRYHHWKDKARSYRYGANAITLANALRRGSKKS